jgi:hypothetical protein
MADDKSIPNEQHRERTERGRDQPCALIGSIPTHSLTQERGNERSGYTECGRQYKSHRLIRSRRQKARYQTSDKANDYDP